jgi:diguanylate cyclase (GGDEF)-like protein
MRLSAREIKSIVKELEQAVIEHRVWLHGWHRSLIFDLPVDPICYSRESFRQCRFGRWYHGQPSPALHEYSGFEVIDRTHRRLHETTFALAEKIKRGKKISIRDYDNLIDKEWKFSNAVFGLRDELLETLFEFDPLTGILNRQAFSRILTREYARASRTNQPCCICMVDLDYFKKINDTYGHLAGDIVLHTTAQYLNQKLRPYDWICRYGGEEFLICLPDTTPQVAEKIVNRLRIGVASLTFEPYTEIQLTVSFGIAKMATDMPIAESIGRADAALYVAKQSGRDQVVVHGNSP